MKYFLWLFIIFIQIPVYSNPYFFIEKIETSNYPKVKVYLKKSSNYNFSSKNIILKETKGNLLRFPSPHLLSYKKGMEQREINLIFVIPSSVNIEKNEFLSNFFSEIIKNTNKKNTFSFINYSGEFLNLNKDLSRIDALNNLNIPATENESISASNFELVFNKIKNITHNNSFIIFWTNQQKTELNDQTIHIINSIKVPIFFLYNISSETNEHLKHTRLTLLNSLDKDSKLKLYNEIEYYSIEPDEITYFSTFDQEMTLLNDRKIKLEFKTTKANHSIFIEYEISNFIFVLNKLLSPAVFFPSMLFFLIIIVVGLLLLNLDNSGKLISKKLFRKNNDSSSASEEDIYNKMYPESNSHVFEESDEEYFEEEKTVPVSSENEFEMAEEYNVASIIVKNGDQRGVQFKLENNENIIGNSEEADISIPEVSIDPMHFKIKNVKNRYILYDLISNKGTFLNGKKLLRPKALYDFDEIQIGKIILVFRGR